MIPDFEQIWATLPFPAFVLDAQNQLSHANSAAEQMVKSSAKQLRMRSVASLFGENSLIAATVAQARAKSGSLMQYNVEVGLNDVDPITCNLHVAPLGADTDTLLLLIQPTGVAQKMTHPHTWQPGDPLLRCLRCLRMSCETRWQGFQARRNC